MKVYLDSIGCRLNQSEIERIGRQIRSFGHYLAGNPDEADLAIINTCAVTAKASSESRSKARNLGRRTRQGVVLTGCWSTIEPQEALELPHVVEIVPNTQKSSLVQVVIPDDRIDSQGGMIAREPLPGLRSRTRAFVKVQDGCDLKCTFCVTTIARGAGRSLPIAKVLDDIRYAQRGGANEVVLTGVHLGSWGTDMHPRLSLADLIRTILNETRIARLRLSSLEPWDLENNFFSLWENPRLCRHLHLPLQSGSDRILRRMGRRTTTHDFAELVSTARARIPGLAITTDLIAGFPGETLQDFQRSLEFVRSLQLAGGHVFPFSEREGTAATRLPNSVPERERKERSSMLRNVLKQGKLHFYKNHVGTQQHVLWEAISAAGPDGLEIRGWTDNYIRVEYKGPQKLSNTISRVRLQELNPKKSAIVAKLVT